MKNCNQNPKVSIQKTLPEEKIILSNGVHSKPGMAGNNQTTLIESITVIGIENQDKFPCCSSEGSKIIK